MRALPTGHKGKWTILSGGIELSPIPLAARFRAWVCCRSLPGVVGSNAAGGMEVCFVWVLYVVRYRSPLRGDHSSRGVLPSVMCPMVWSRSPVRGGHDPKSGRSATGKNFELSCYATNFVFLLRRWEMISGQGVAVICSIMLEICYGVAWVWVHAVLCKRVSLLSWRAWLWFCCTYLNYCR
jgi:hypothetical protein